MGCNNLKRTSLALALFVSAILICAAISASVSLWTQGYGNSRTNANTAETRLPALKVTTGSFGYLGTDSTAGFVFGQPLVVPYTIGSASNVLVVADMSNNVAAFNADRIGSAPLWQTNLGTLASLVQSDFNNFDVPKGVMSTPVVDLTNGWVFVVSAQTISSASQWVLEKLSLATGSVLSSVTVSGAYPGTGSGLTGECTSGSNVVFCFTTTALSRPALTLANGTIYACFGQADVNAWHGWVISYNESLTQQAIWLPTPNGNGGSIWHVAPAVDGSGSIYVVTGNGTYDGATSNDFAMSLVKLNGSTLALQDWYTPSNWSSLDSVDADVSSASPILASSKVIFGGKDWNIHVLSQTCLGQLGGTANGCTPQLVQTPNAGTVTGGTGIYSAGVLMNGFLYVPTNASFVYSYVFSGSLAASPTATSTNTFKLHGAMMTGSANNTSDGIIWCLSQATSNFSSAEPGILTALDAGSLVDIWDSTQVSGDALPGNVPKLIMPTVANGKVYVPTSSGVSVYGVRGSSQLGGSTISGGNSVTH
jgi:hypothetical protein